MAKISPQRSPKNSESSSSSSHNNNSAKVKKRTRKSIPRDSPPQRSSAYRGVTRHRWTGRYEAHLWDKNCWNQSQNKKGRQVYLGAYDVEEAAARAYDLAALKYWGQDILLNFPLSNYQEELKEMEALSKEEYVGSLRRKSSGFSRGVSKYRGVARHHHNGRWEARIGRVLGNKYLYLGTYATQEEAAAAYDVAAIEYRGINAVTNFDLSRYIKLLRPKTEDNHEESPSNPEEVNPNSELELEFASNQLIPSTADETVAPPPQSGGGAPASSALGILLHSPKFKEMLLERSASAVEDYDSATRNNLEPNHPPSRRIFPEDIQTYFGCQDSGSSSYSESDHDMIFGDLTSISAPIFHCELDDA